MKSLIITFLTCILAYFLVVLCTGGFKVDSDTYGYYKNGRLNERGIISIVDRVRRMIPMKTPDTTVVGINYNYRDDTVPHGQINYYHVVDKDKLDYYRRNSQEVVNRVATAQCSNSDIVEMLGKLDKITISFYDGDVFLYGMEVSSETCGSGSKITNTEPSNARDGQGITSADKSDGNNKDAGDGDTGSDLQGNPSVKKHVLAMNKILPFQNSFGELYAVEEDNVDGIRHRFRIKEESVDKFKKDMKNISGKVVQSYCKNTKMSGLLQKIHHISLDFEYQNENLLSLQISRDTCNALN
ncbi:MAG: hypothetical protein ACI4VX_02320 [Succinivibrionaceae bacterium]